MEDVGSDMPHLVACWPLSEGAGHVMHDCAASGAHGVVLGSKANVEWADGARASSQPSQWLPWDAARAGSGLLVSEHGATVRSIDSTDSWMTTVASAPIQGRVSWHIKVTKLKSSMFIGVSSDVEESGYIGNTKSSWGLLNSGEAYNGSSRRLSKTGFVVGDIVTVEVDLSLIHI